MIHIYVDGAAKQGGNGAACAYVFFTTRRDFYRGQDITDKVLYEGGAYLGMGISSNAAEYYALIHALELCKILELRNGCFFSDSELLVKQIAGEYRITKPWLQELADACLNYLGNQGGTLTYIPREQNKVADALAKKVLEKEQPYRRCPDAKALHTEIILTNNKEV